MTRLMAFGEPRLDADLASIIDASSSAKRPIRTITPTHQKRAIAGAIVAFLGGLGMAQYLSEPLAPEMENPFVAVPPFETLASNDFDQSVLIPAPPPIEEPKIAPKPKPKRFVSDRYRPPRPARQAGGKANGEGSGANGPGFASGSSRPAPRPDSGPPDRLVGPRGTVRFPGSSAGLSADRSDVLISGAGRPEEEPKKRTMLGRRGPRHVKQNWNQ